MGKTVFSSNKGADIKDPTDAQLRERLAALDLKRDGEGFAILERDSMTYMQVGGDAQQGFVMEYQEGDTDRHYSASRRDFTLDEIVAAMRKYRDDGMLWEKYGPWERLEL